MADHPLANFNKRRLVFDSYLVATIWLICLDHFQWKMIISKAHFEQITSMKTPTTTTVHFCVLKRSRKNRWPFFQGEKKKRGDTQPCLHISSHLRHLRDRFATKALKLIFLQLGGMNFLGSWEPKVPPQSYPPINSRPYWLLTMGFP